MINPTSESMSTAARIGTSIVMINKARQSIYEESAITGSHIDMKYSMTLSKLGLLSAVGGSVGFMILAFVVFLITIVTIILVRYINLNMTLFTYALLNSFHYTLYIGREKKEWQVSV